MQPISIQQGNRKAVICGDTVKLMKVSGEKRITETTVWPETRVERDQVADVAWKWVKQGFVVL